MLTELANMSALDGSWGESMTSSSLGYDTFTIELETAREQETMFDFAEGFPQRKWQDFH
ncbi:MAG: hypothetical protein R2883_05645 [Caldisericia bacterium]